MENFKLVSDFLSITTRSFELADAALLNPNSALPLVMGEFLEIDSAYKMARGTGSGTGLSFAYFQFQGAYDVQALGKGPFLYLNQYEADTKIFEDGIGGGALAMNGPVIVGDLTSGRRGLVPMPAAPAGTERVVGYVTRMPSVNNGYLRFVRVS